MSFPGAIHTCTIQSSSLASNGIGEAVETWSNLATSVPCRLYNIAGEEVATQGGPVNVTWKLMLPYGQTCTEKHRITSVTDARGTTLASEANVLLVHHDPSGQFHHKECWLHNVRTY